MRPIGGVALRSFAHRAPEVEPRSFLVDELHGPFNGLYACVLGGYFRAGAGRVGVVILEDPEAKSLSQDAAAGVLEWS
jgi:hypothetical protein